MIYQLISEDTVDGRLEAKPTQLWTLVTIEVVVRVADQPYLAVTCPSYRTGLGQAAWAVPFHGFPVTGGSEWGMPSTIGALRKAFATDTNLAKEEESRNSCIYHYGLTGSSVTKLPDFIEIKDSFRDRGVVKAYRVVRWYATELTELAQTNLVDLNGMKNIALLPLRHDTGDLFRTFRGHEVLSNVAHVARLHSRSDIASGIITADMFLMKRKGILICFDLAGYGAACNHCSDLMGTFLVDGPGAWAEFTTEFHWRLFTELEAAGVSEIQFTGDGFVCAIELIGNKSSSHAVEKILMVHRRLHEFVECWANPRIGLDRIKLGSRMAIHIGDYRYGKIGLAASSAPQLDGKSIVEACRLEAGLRSEVIRRQLPRGHYVVLSEAAQSALFGGEPALPLDYKYLDRCELKEKEFKSLASVFEFARDGSVSN